MGTEYVLVSMTPVLYVVVYFVALGLKEAVWNGLPEPRRSRGNYWILYVRAAREMIIPEKPC